jgi:acyl carrier protein phosphodiesterase
MTLTNRSDPLIVYIHIPKTAGSTVNQVLRDWDANGKGHTHIVMNGNPDALGALLNSATWVSGHSNLENFMEVFPRYTNRELKFHTIMRDPARQVASHYNWLIEIFHKGGNFYNNHSRPIKEISKAIRANDNADPEAVIAILKKYSKLFLNQQARYVLGPSHRDFSIDAVKQRLKIYEHIATEEDLPQFLKQITGSAVEAVPTKNASKYHFNKEVFSSPQMTAFLENGNGRDHMLDALIKSV